jgi:hypothetical protein
MGYPFSGKAGFRSSFSPKIIVLVGHSVPSLKCSAAIDCSQLAAVVGGGMTLMLAG